MPSDRLTSIKAVSLLGTTKKQKTNFAHAYNAGTVPCHINHGCNKMLIKWDIPPEQLDYDPILVNCFEGLQETDHPYSFVAF